MKFLIFGILRVIPKNNFIQRTLLLNVKVCINKTIFKIVSTSKNKQSKSDKKGFKHSLLKSYKKRAKHCI